MDLSALNTTWVWVVGFVVIVLLFLSKINLIFRLSNKSHRDQAILNEELEKAREKLAQDFQNTLQSIDLDLSSEKGADFTDLNAQRLLEQSRAFQEFKEKNQSGQIRKRAQSLFQELDKKVVKKPSNHSVSQESE